MTVTFAGEVCDVEFSKYQNGRTAIQLWCEDGPMATATINIPEYPLGKDEVIIKDYSENAGLLEVLVNAGVVKDTGKRVESGYIVAPVCKLQ